MKMKKVLKTAYLPSKGKLIFAGIFLVSFVCNFSSRAQKIFTQAHEDSYQFPVQPNSEKWKAFETHNEMLEACTLPQGSIDQLSTDALISTCLYYPLLTDLTAYEEWQTGFRNVCNGFNGLQELLRRKDAGQKLFGIYTQANPAGFDEGLPWLDKARYCFRLGIVEMLLCQDAVLENFSPEEKKALLDKCLQTEQLKKALPEWYSLYGRIPTHVCMAKVLKSLNDNTFEEKLSTQVQLDYFLHNGNLVVDESLFNEIQLCANAQLGKKSEAANSTEKVEQCDSPGTVTTPNNSTVHIQVYNCEPYSSSDLSSFEAYNTQNYPSAIKIGPPTGMYNCHSYSWHLQSLSNKVWMNDNGTNNGPSQYWLDNSYVEVTPLVDTSYRITYNESNGTNDHTAYQRPSHGKTTQSKWGGSPLYAHNINYVPYPTNNKRMFKRNSSTGISTYTNEEGLFCYPNPSNGLVHITLPEGAGFSTVEIYDYSGNLVYKVSLAGTSLNIDLRAYSKGIYLATILNNKEQKHIKLIIE